jgi:hypothetical protein
VANVVLDQPQIGIFFAVPPEAPFSGASGAPDPQTSGVVT